MWFVAGKNSIESSINNFPIKFCFDNQMIEFKTPLELGKNLG